MKRSHILRDVLAQLPGWAPAGLTRTDRPIIAHPSGVRVPLPQNVGDCRALKNAVSQARRLVRDIEKES